jgi:protein-S-isoprenylcysteine O-methyltransferase Ste14
MTPVIAKAIFALLIVGWYAIRAPHEWRAWHMPVRRSARDHRELAVILIAIVGLGTLPLLYIVTGFPRFADYPFNATQAWSGAIVAIAALGMFYLTHKALGTNWSVSLDVRKDHRLITNGVYRYIRHPMYIAFWLWALAQALLLPNWMTGLSGIVGFGLLYFLRVSREEQLMIDAFGEGYRSYMLRTKRLIPWIH